MLKKREQIYAIRKDKDGLPFIQVLDVTGVMQERTSVVGIKLKQKIEGDDFQQFGYHRGRKYLKWRALSRDYSRGWFFDDLSDAIIRIQHHCKKLEEKAMDAFSQVASIKCRIDKIKLEKSYGKGVVNV